MTSESRRDAIEEVLQRLRERKRAWQQEEKCLRRDHKFRQSMGLEEQSAAHLIGKVCNQLKNKPSSVGTTSAVNGCFYFPDMPFSQARPLLQDSALWDAISTMPKGCLLHAHAEAMIEPEWLVEKALSIPGYSVASPQPLDPFGQGTNAAIPIGRVAASHPSGPEGFIRWAKAHMSITPEETLSARDGIDVVWRKSASCFTIAAGLFYTEPIFRRYIRELLHRLHTGGIRYVELRMALLQPFQRQNHSKCDSDFFYLFDCLQQELDAYMSSSQGAGFWGARTIWSAVRSLPDDAIRRNLADCIACKKRYAGFLCGVDLIGQEDCGWPLSALIPVCLRFRRRCVEEGIELPFIFHAGECRGDGNETDWNLADATLLGSRRIGHGFSLYKHPVLIEKVKEHSILVETCPISQEVLRLTSSAAAHPLPALLSRGVATALGNDDPGMLGHGGSGLEHDFMQVLLACDSVGLEGIAEMAENSDEWLKRLEWRRDFRAWCGRIVDRSLKSV
ncbi:uncharacterized protein BDV14DRAFT_210095 [Aspergillus stella-maris]|uniref:uncharacterized protein n=1 Tax=Aspergillus stella-maris TaxID=1810926 RepID=UPI003CCCCA40